MTLTERCGYDMGRQWVREGTDVVKNDVDCRWTQRTRNGHGLTPKIKLPNKYFHFNWSYIIDKLVTSPFHQLCMAVVILPMLLLLLLPFLAYAQVLHPF